MKLNFTDINGKSFNMSLSELTDMTGDLPTDMTNLTDADYSHQKLFSPVICDSEGKDVNVQSLLDAIKADASNRPRAIDVTFEATHSGTNKNHFTYPSDALEQGATSWKTPFPKPLIKNHDLEVEPIGRVHDFSFGASEIVDGVDTISVTFRVTDQDAIDKFLDRRYHTMSIGANAGHIRCNVCGKDIVKDGEFKFCGHMKGHKYNNQLATWTARDFEYKEGSIVNNPADVWAQVKRIAIVNSETKDKGVSDMDQTPTQVTDHADDATLLDGILEDNQSIQENPKDEAPVAEDNTTIVEDDAAEPQATSLEDELKATKEQLDALRADYEVIEQDRQALSDQVQTLETELSESNQALTDKEVVISDMKKQNVRLALLNKKLMVDRIMDYEMVTHKIEATQLDDRRTELSAMKAAELTDLMDFDWTKESDEPAEPTRQRAAQVANPGLADNSASNIIEDTEEAPVQEDNKPSLKDLENSLIDLFTRRY